MDGILVLGQIRSESIKAVGLWIPPHAQSYTPRLALDEPFHVELGPLAFGTWREDGLNIAILTGGEPLAVFPRGVEPPGMPARVAPHHKEAAMAIDVSHRGQGQGAPGRQAYIASQALGLRPGGVVGISVWTQGNRAGGILKQSQGAVECDSRRTPGVEAAGKPLGQGLVQGKRTPILQEKTVECTDGLASCNAQALPRQLTHAGAQGGAEALGRSGFEPWLLEGFILRRQFPQLLELARHIGKSLDLLGGHGGHHRAAQAQRRDATCALGKSAWLAPLIEDIFIEDRLELVGHRDQWLGSHPTFLSFLEGGVGWIFPAISRISRG